MGLMKIQNPLLGDEHLEWDPDDAASVQAARQRFNALVNPQETGSNPHSFNAYAIERVPRPVGEPIQDFDPSLGEILIVAQMAGG